MKTRFALLTGKRVRWTAAAAGALVFAWALVRIVPLVVDDTFIGGSWTRAGKALVVLGGLCALAARDFPATTAAPRLLLAGRIALGAFMILCGFQHFRWEEFVATLVPAWVPGGGILWTRVSGVLLILGGTGLLIPMTARLAARLSGLMIFLWVFLLHLPRAFAAVDAAGRQNEWIAVVEATAFSGLAFFLAGRGRDGAFDAKLSKTSDRADAIDG